MKKFFFGGIHPKYNKEMSIKDQIPVVTPKQVVIPMQQHIGAPCVPLVQVGDLVKRGQKIGDSEGLCVPVHASVSGKVVEIGEKPHPTYGKTLAVVIENDFTDTAIESTPCESLEADDILHAIREAGIVGMGGAAFPGNIKALTALGKVDTLIANGCECEPYITADDCLLQTQPEQVLAGMMILHELLDPENAVLAVEDNKRDAIAKLQAWMPKYPKIKLQVLPTRYPQGAEKQLIQSVTGRQVAPGQLPATAGCAVFNVSTFAAIFRAVRQGTALTSRIVTVTGEGIAKPQNFMVPIGTSFADLLEQAGGYTPCADRLISGGPMMGFAQTSPHVPVVKATNAILCLAQDKNGAADNPVCLRCGKCVGVCPMHLQPLYMYRFREDVKELERLHLMDCMECGSCAFTCPGKLPLVESFRQSKKRMKEAAKK